MKLTIIINHALVNKKLVKILVSVTITESTKKKLQGF